MRTAKFLFWLGIIIMVVGICGNGYTFIHAVGRHVLGYNAGSFIVAIFSPLWQGGLLVGIAKVIEIVSQKQSERSFHKT